MDWTNVDYNLRSEWLVFSFVEWCNIANITRPLDKPSESLYGAEYFFMARYAISLKKWRYLEKKMLNVWLSNKYVVYIYSRMIRNDKTIVISFKIQKHTFQEQKASIVVGLSVMCNSNECKLLIVALKMFFFSD